VTQGPNRGARGGKSLGFPASCPRRLCGTTPKAARTQKASSTAWKRTFEKDGFSVGSCGRTGTFPNIRKQSSNHIEELAGRWQAETAADLAYQRPAERGPRGKKPQFPRELFPERSLKNTAKHFPQGGWSNVKIRADLESAFDNTNNMVGFSGASSNPS